MRATLKSKAHINAIFNAGKKSSTPGVIVFWGSGPKRSIAVLAGKKLGPAPLRSRAKRRIRAALSCAEIDCAQEVVLLATRVTARRDFESLVNDIRRAFTKDMNKLK